VEPLKGNQYERAKRLLDAGKHPTFIGRNLVARCAMNGGAFIFSAEGADVAVAIVNPRNNCLLVLNVHPHHRSHGLGAAVLEYLQCNFARVLETAVPFFQRRGYVSVGQMHQGKSLKTQVMVKGSLIPLAGRIASLLALPPSTDPTPSRTGGK